MWQTDNRINASRLEYYIKRLTKEEKERLIIDKNIEIVSKKINSKNYIEYKI